MTQDGGNVAAPERTAARTIRDYQLFVADLLLRCRPREGFVATRVELRLDSIDLESLENLCRALALLSSRDADIKRLVSGGGRR